jgi:hypothetical protein
VAGGTSVSDLNLEAEWIARLEQTFPPDALERITRAEYDYYSTHGDYLPGLAKLALHYLEQRDMLSHRADWKHPDDHASVCAALEAAEASLARANKALLRIAEIPLQSTGYNGQTHYIARAARPKEST